MKTERLNNKKPLIGILTNILTVESGILAGTKRIYVNRDYVNSILRAGGTPILLPIISNEEAMCNQIEAVDAILISGGFDVHPHNYNEEPSHLLEAVSLERDEYEMAVIKHAYQLQKPIFGVCRGMQLINVVFGGTLYQDIANFFPNLSFQHTQKSNRDDVSHTVDIKQNSWLSSVFQKESLLTNSFHHQAIKNLASGFQATAWAKDGVIEGIEKIDGSFVAGVQWHPEMMTEKNADMHQLFCAFVSLSSKNTRMT